MFFTYSKAFKKKYKSLNAKIKKKVEERLSIFIQDEFEEILNNHKLHGEYEGFRSINVTSDIRIIYKVKDKEEYRLHFIGTHSELYE